MHYKSGEKSQSYAPNKGNVNVPSVGDKGDDVKFYARGPRYWCRWYFQTGTKRFYNWQSANGPTADGVETNDIRKSYTDETFKDTLDENAP